MMSMNAWKPAGYPSMSPYLICKHAERLIGFLKDAFGGVLLRRFDRPDGSLMHAEAGIDDGVVMIAGTHKLVLHYRCREPARRDVRRYHRKPWRSFRCGQFVIKAAPPSLPRCPLLCR